MHKRPSRTHQAYALLRERIATGQLSPGSVVSEATLAKEFGLSRTPVGEALRRLSQEGLVEQVPRYGTIVREVSASELVELFEIREALEGMAAAKAAERITDEALEQLDSLCCAIESEAVSAKQSGAHRLEGEALRRFLSADMAFHMLIIASAHNRRLTSLVEQTRSISSMFSARRGEHSLTRVSSANAAHRAILGALAARDADEAQRQVVQHVRVSRDQSLLQASPVPTVNLDTINLPDFVRQDLAVGAAGN